MKDDSDSTSTQAIASNRHQAFIDGANIDKQARDLGFTLDHRRLRNYLEVALGITEAHFYTGSQFTSYVERLERFGFTVTHRTGPTRSDGSVKADIDVHLAVDMVRRSGRLESVVLVSGDGDFVPAVEYMKEQGIPVSVISGTKDMAWDLRRSADQIIDLAALRDKLALQRSPAPDGAGTNLPLGMRASKGLLSEVLEAQVRQNAGRPVQIGGLKSRMRQLQRRFDERALGFRSFSDYLGACAEIVMVERCDRQYYARPIRGAVV